MYIGGAKKSDSQLVTPSWYNSHKKSGPLPFSHNDRMEHTIYDSTHILEGGMGHIPQGIEVRGQTKGQL